MYPTILSQIGNENRLKSKCIVVLKVHPKCPGSNFRDFKIFGLLSRGASRILNLWFGKRTCNFFVSARFTNVILRSSLRPLNVLFLSFCPLVLPARSLSQPNLVSRNFRSAREWSWCFLRAFTSSFSRWTVLILSQLMFLRGSKCLFKSSSVYELSTIATCVFFWQNQFVGMIYIWKVPFQKEWRTISGFTEEDDTSK